jgi:predicted RNA-binding Zn-ribbon protein involved in translation (DUF1610 family)
MGEGVIWEPAGARITMPSGKGVIPPSGLAIDFKVQGDFEITFAYEILNAEQPTKGYGVGASLYVAINPKTGNAVTLARRVLMTGETRFLSTRLPIPAKPQIVRSAPSQSPAGKLRIQRTGTKVRFLFAEGDEPEFKEVNEVEFGADDIAFVQIGGNAGNSENALDMRLLELSIRAERLPGFSNPAGDDPVVLVDAEQNSSSPMWMIVGGAITLGIALLGSAGVVAVIFWRRSSARDAAKPSTTNANSDLDADQTLLSFVCSECGTKLKVRLQLAGKNVKCPHCGRTSAAPRKVAG